MSPATHSCHIKCYFRGYRYAPESSSPSRTQRSRLVLSSARACLKPTKKMYPSYVSPYPTKLCKLVYQSHVSMIVFAIPLSGDFLVVFLQISVSFGAWCVSEIQPIKEQHGCCLWCWLDIHEVVHTHLDVLLITALFCSHHTRVCATNAEVAVVTSVRQIFTTWPMDLCTPLPDLLSLWWSSQFQW